MEGMAVEVEAGVAGSTAMEAEAGVTRGTVVAVTALPAVSSGGSDSSREESLTLLGEDSEETALEEVVPEAGPTDPLVV